MLVPAISPETLSQLQESSEMNDALDFFQNIDVQVPQIVEEINIETITLDTNEVENFDGIPDIEDFENENLLITDDPVQKQ